ncbi:MAG: rhodanese-like domain-containing protein [Pseudomonadota bacterium]
MQTEMIDGRTLEHWSPDEVAAALARNEVILIDVRTPQEFALERIGGALLAPMQELMPQHLPVGGDKLVILHCGSGIRSKRVAEIALAAGTDKIAHMAGGFAAWKSGGHAFTGTDVATGAPKELGGKPGASLAAPGV